MLSRYIKIRVTPNAKKETLLQDKEDHFTLSVKERPEQNQANRRVIELIASHFCIPKQNVKIINGHHSGSKILSINIPE